MPTPIREVALAAIAARLCAQMPDVPIERARRAPIDTDTESVPRLVLRGEDWEADETQEPGATHYRIGVSVTGVVRAITDLDAEQALSALHARVVAALAGWTLDPPGFGDVAEQGAEFRLFDAEESARPAGEFVARFTLLAVTPTGNPTL
jgi:hypothetical protein